MPHLACKPFHHLYPPKINEVCRDVHHFTTDVTNKVHDFTRRHTYERGLRNFRQVYGSFSDLKHSLTSSLGDVYYSTKSFLRGGMGDAKDRFSGVIETTAENAKEYYDAGIQKVHHLIDELKNERKIILGA